MFLYVLIWKLWYSVGFGWLSPLLEWNDSLEPWIGKLVDYDDYYSCLDIIKLFSSKKNKGDSTRFFWKPQLTYLKSNKMMSNWLLILIYTKYIRFGTHQILIEHSKETSSVLLYRPKIGQHAISPKQSLYEWQNGNFSTKMRNTFQYENFDAWMTKFRYR